MQFNQPVALIEILQAKNRFQFDQAGYVRTGSRLRKRLQRRILAEAEKGEEWVFVTLTYDPKKWLSVTDQGEWDDEQIGPGPLRELTPQEESEEEAKQLRFASPEWQKAAADCFAASKAERHTGEFYRRLREHSECRPACFRVTEFQKNGFPHFHLLINQRYLPHSDLTELWGWGMVWITRANDRAAGYLTKYLTKGIQAPNWLIDSGGTTAMRLSYPTRGFWGDGDVVARPDGPEVDPKPRRAPATIAAVMASPKEYLRTSMRVIFQTGEELVWSLQDDIFETFARFCQAGCVLAEQPWGERSAAGIEGGYCKLEARGLSLDLLLNCGRSP
jgi:hypothetical protein